MAPRWIPVVVAAGVGLGVLALAEAPRTKPRTPSQGIVDRRAFAQLTANAAEHTRSRPAEDVYALVLHQMGFSRGSDPERYDKVTAHYVVLPDGGVYQLHDHTQRLPAAGGLNTGSVSVEFAGNLPSRARSTHRSHFWRPDTHGSNQLTGAQVAGGRMLVDTLFRQGWLSHILAHRQGGPGRGLDPGPDIWREVGAWAVWQYGLEWGGPSFAVNGGSPIPAHWWGAVA